MTNEQFSAYNEKDILRDSLNKGGDKVMSSMITTTYTFVPGAVDSTYLSLVKFLEEVNQLDALRNAFQLYTPYFLISYGNVYESSFTKKKTSKIEKPDTNVKSPEINYINRYDKLFQCGAKLFLDSGGYQISMGRIPESEISFYIPKYHNFVKYLESKLGENFHTFFYLDAIVGKEGKLEHESVVRHWCFQSLRHLIEESGIVQQKNIWKKFNFVMHTTSIPRYYMWKDFMNYLIQNDAIPEKYSIGGLVAGGSRYKDSQILHWSYGLLFLLNHFKERGVPRDYYRQISFHVLGLVEISGVTSLYLIGEYLRKRWGIGINFTYDGTSLLKKFLMGRMIGYIDPNTKCYRNVFFSSAKKQTAVNDKNTVEEYMLKILHHFWSAIMYEPVDSRSKYSIYEYSGGPFVKDVGLWLPFIEVVLQDEYREVYRPLAEKCIDAIFSNNWDVLFDFTHLIMSNQSINAKKQYIKQVTNTIKIIDKIMESSSGIDFLEEVLVPSLTVTEVW